MIHIYPLKLRGVTKSPIWGGTRLLHHWNKTSGNETVGESWELTVRAAEQSRVSNGIYSGRTLAELLVNNAGDIMGASFYSDGAFPLLVKMIDAADRLSVQVHPDDAYAANVENDRGKTEMWYIVEADENAEIICGLADGVTQQDFADAVANGTLESALRHQRVRAGETYFIPSGLPHAIGKGILIAEIQQNCDLTYRVYDYDRRDKNGNLRALHVKKALDVIRPFSEDEVEAIRYSRGKADGVLANCAYFCVEKLDVNGNRSLPADVHMRHLLCLSGDISLVGNSFCEPVTKGDSYLLPAALENVELCGKGTLLLSIAY
ncbi:MAG: class I mannose-6-phosphate isomerase [Clostridia bacterium]|nr:class I mannose-6-phosphate isomerase [Clostridia bacterium]